MESRKCEKWSREMIEKKDARSKQQFVGRYERRMKAHMRAMERKEGKIYPRVLASDRNLRPKLVNESASTMMVDDNWGWYLDI